ncbi:hypothetical protein [Nocardia sp. NPDC050406]|uniref:hypothetical protein n=1 Tax=Nocardia sp. NPDC050406 TaxID=3364318 RepID=UPI00379E761D
MAEGDGRAALLAEIEAFYAGFGQAESLTAAFRDAALLVPVSDDRRILLSRYGGVAWVYGFTSEAEYARYIAARRAQPDASEDPPYRFHTLFGRRLVDWFAAHGDEPTGIVVNIAGAQPMAFPPDLSESSRPMAGAPVVGPPARG